MLVFLKGKFLTGKRLEFNESRSIATVRQVQFLAAGHVIHLVVDDAGQQTLDSCRSTVAAEGDLKCYLTPMCVSPLNTILFPIESVGSSAPLFICS